MVTTGQAEQAGKTARKRQAEQSEQAEHATQAAQIAQAALCQITTEPIEAQELIDAVQTPADGAVCVFYGVVREDSQNKKVRFLEYDAYPEMAIKKMRVILEEVATRWPEQRAAIAHRIGKLGIGEASVIIAVGSPHRGESFEACRYIIDRVKQEVPIWKKEVFTDGEAWVEGS